MAKPRIPSQKIRYGALNQRLNRYMMLVQQIFDDLNLETAKAATSVSYDGSKPFRFSDYPVLAQRAKDLQQRYVDDIGTVIYSGTSAEWKKSNEVQDLLADGVLKAYGAQVNGERYKVYYQPNNDALKAFQKRRANGMTLSQKLWNQARNYKEEMEYAISSAIEKGTSAVTLSKRLSKYLHDFPSLQKDYKDKFGKAVDCHDCEYRSMRLARSEINMAYRTAEQERWQQMDFVVGYEIKVSKAHKIKDICDLLAGKYPKDFYWTGWHPNCYSDDMSVLTDSGWKLFSEVNEDDLIMSLNPETRQVEYVPFVAKQCYDVNGSLIHFHNKTLDCLVTNDHRMVYLNKSDGRIKYCSAKDYTKGNGAFYRGCEYRAEDVEFIEVEGRRYNFDDFCEFLGYYLADGSLQREAGIVLSQRVGEPAFEKMLSIIERLGFTSHICKDVISFYNSSLCRYLRQFGKSYQKFIPTIVKSASRKQIQIFLDAFILCDGYKRPSKSFVGNRGNVFNSDKEERLYFTTSERMAGDLSELLLKVGKRPSFTKKLSKSHTIASGKVIKSNYPCYVISECAALTSTVFSKEEVEYVGKVYDLTLERNHIMYVSRNGKCFWGSNCMDYKIPILKTEEEFWNYGEAKFKPSDNEVKDVPIAFKNWVEENALRISKAEKRGTLPYFLKDNPRYVKMEDVKIIRDRIMANFSLLPLDDQIEVRRLFAEGASAPVITSSMQRIASRLEDSLSEYQIWAYNNSPVIKKLFDELYSENVQRGAPIERVKLVSKIKDKVAVLTRWELRKCGAIDGLEYVGMKKNHTISPKMSLYVKRTDEYIDIPAYKLDLVTFKDKNGKEYSYRLGSRESNIPFKASEASAIVGKLPKAMQDSFKGILFDYKPHPLEAYHRKAYVGFTRAAMYSGEPISVHIKEGAELFKKNLCHEIGHHLDDGISSSNEWVKAMKLDGSFVSDYAKKDVVEDFAETFAHAFGYLDDPNWTWEEFEHAAELSYPNRWKILKKIFEGEGFDFVSK